MCSGQTGWFCVFCFQSLPPHPSTFSKEKTQHNVYSFACAESSGKNVIRWEGKNKVRFPEPVDITAN